MVEPHQIVADCQQANAEGGHHAVLEVVQRIVSDPAAVLRTLGEPQRAGVGRLFVSDELTVLNIVWGPHMTLMPHNHNMWAVIGIYTGREDNIFWRRDEGRTDGHLTARGARALGVKDCVPLGPEVIHSVTNPVQRLTGALHVYGGDFFATPRSEWNPETLLEGVYDVEKNLRLFEESNRRRITA